jgi:thiosulfate/3-mercaptopyruvate sulfurtransferase
LISTAALAAHLDQSWVVVDCRYDLTNADWGREQYRAGHIPGAVYASLSHDLAGPPAGGGGRHPLPPREAVEATFGRLGIAPGIQVVAYDQDVGMFASRLWWMLRYLGHEHAAVLDGGWARWVAEGRAIRRGDERRPPAVFSGRPRDELCVEAAHVAAGLDRPSVLLVDARAPERFEGQVEPIDRVAGHIPGALNRHYRENVSTDGLMLPPAVLREQFEQLLSGRPADDVVMYCGSGVSACHNLLAMEHAGLRGARLYPGSWSEWSSDPAKPVETGPAREKR